MSVATPADAQSDPCRPVAMGGTFTVNQRADARVADVAMFADGRAIVVYHGLSSGTDDDGVSVQARFIDAGGELLGDEFQVNTFIEQDQMNAAVAVAPNGGFVVVWRSDVSPGDMDDSSIRARVYRADGSPAGVDFRVNDVTEDHQERPRVAMGNDGFVVVWQSDSTAGDDSDGLSVQARRFDSNGAPLDSQLQVNTLVGGSQAAPDVAMHPDGRFVVVWESSRTTGDDNNGPSVQIRRYSPAGESLAPERQLNTVTRGRQIEARVAMDFSDASFLVVWRGEKPVGDDDGWSIQARGMLWNGTTVTPSEFQVNRLTENLQSEADVANVGPAEYAVAWRPTTRAWRPRRWARFALVVI